MKLFRLPLILSFLFIIGTCQSAVSQNPGDTIVVQTLDYNATTRDTMVTFPDLEGVTYSKVLMQYNMRCHGANINTTGGNGIACGEWDYSCNTYLQDPSRIDSIDATTPSHLISGFTGSSFDYTSTPTYTIHQTNQETAIVNNVISETEATVQGNSFSAPDAFPTDKNNAKSQFVYAASELTGSGAVAGNMDALAIYVSEGSTSTDFLRVRLKSIDSFIDIANPELTGWTEVYFSNTNLISGRNVFQFTTPFDWDGISNIAVELSYSNPATEASIALEAGIAGNDMSFGSSDDSHLIFNQNNYIEANYYKGIGGSQNRTIEAWIKTETPDKEIVSWGKDNTGEKWVFRLNGNGALRVEINGAGVDATTVLTDGEWHHVACVLDGSTLASLHFYVDGNLETNSSASSAVVNTNTTDGINLRVSRGVNDRYFIGEMDDVRIWDTALSGNDIANGRYLKSNELQNSGSLVVDYAMNEGSGISIHNGFNLHATVKGGAIWKDKKGIDLFKDFEKLLMRPRMGFIQGEYDLTITDNTVNDTIFNLPNPVIGYAISHNYNTILSDDIVGASYNTYWQATENVILNPEGEEIENTPVEPEGTITITHLPYEIRSASKIELMSFVTPYGIQLDLGPNGKTYTFDMTDYLPILNGTKRMTMERGGQWQEEFDIKFLFIVGTPPRDVLDMRQIWRVDQRNYSEISNNTYYEPRDVPTLATGQKFMIRSAITGHGQEGEFVPRQHYIDIDGGTNEFQWQVWKPCGSNPIFPQGGTWIFDRAGWCPGAATEMKEWDITQYVTPGETVNIDYGIITASGDSRYIVSHQLVTYGAPNFSTDASILEVERPSNRVEFSRQGPICNDPTVVIQNLGSADLTSAKIEYWVNDNPAPLTFNWTGNLAMLETEQVVLPANDELWSTVTAEGNHFFAHITSPNGQEDENTPNDLYKSSFNIPPVLPADFIIMFKTNLHANENHFEVLDENDNVVFSRANMTNSTLYFDTLHLAPGCYTYKVYDSDGDGLNFFANNDGAGFTRIKQVGGSTLYYLEADFGDDLQFPFTVEYPLSFEELNPKTVFDVFPSPTRDKIHVNLSGFDAEVDLMIYNSLGQRVYSQRLRTSDSKYRGDIDLSGFESGVYIVRINDGTRTGVQKVVKN